MLLKDYRVKIPSDARIQKKDDGYYVYKKIGYIYHSDKKQSTEKRKCIGKKENDELMIPNENYSLYYDDLELNLSEPNEFSDTLKIGNIVLFDKIVTDLGLDDILDIHGEKKDTLLNLASYMIINESSIFQYYPEFAYNHNIKGRIYTDSFISKYLQSFTDKEIVDFLNAWNSLYKNETKIYINYDSSNMNSSSDGLQLLEYGHSKKDIDLKQVNLSIASLASNATPLFYELYPGSIIDNAELKSMANEAISYGYKDIGFILDRGYYSKSNINYLEDRGYSYIMMIKDNNNFVKLLKQDMKTLINTNNINLYIADYSIYGKTYKSKLFESDSKQKYIHVYFDEQQAVNEKNTILSNVSKIKRYLDLILESEDTKQRHISKCERFSKLFNLHYVDEYLVSYTIKKAEIQKQINNCGYFALISSEKYEAKDIIYIYRNRDSIEKLFLSLKSHLDLDTLRSHSDKSLRARIHIGFIASIIRNELFNNLKQLKLEYSDRKNYTVPAVIKELEKIECSKNKHGLYEKRYILTSKQKRILNLFNIDDKYIEQEVKHINSQMKQLFPDKY